MTTRSLLTGTAADELRDEAISHPAPATTQSADRGPRILYVTPEISHVSPRMCPGAENIRAKSGGLADVSASLVDRLLSEGADIHLAIPHYRNLFRNGRTDHDASRICAAPHSRVHLAEDCAFYRRIGAYHGDPDDLRRAALAFQRELFHHIIPRVQPDIIHCNDWMTGLIPAACRKLGIKTLFTIHNIHHQPTTLAEIENKGIDAHEFWDLLYYENYPGSFEEAYHHNPVDILSSAIRNADYVSTVSPTFLEELIQHRHGNLPPHVRWDLIVKNDASYAGGILNAPDPSFDPARDPALVRTYNHLTHTEGKRANKQALQQRLGLSETPEAPVFYWPSRLDPGQKGCQLLTDILHQTVADHERVGLQIVIVGDGSHEVHFHNIISQHGLEKRVAIRNFDESLARLAYAGSDFVLMPSSFEPCGLPQMIGALHGTLPIVHDTGGLHDTVEPLSADRSTGNGFLFDCFEADGLRRAIEQATGFHQEPAEAREPVIRRVMWESHQRFSPDHMFGQYAAIYRKLARDKAMADQTP